MRVTTNVLFDGVIHCLVRCKASADTGVNGAFVSTKVGIFCYGVHEDWLQCCRGNVWNVMRAHFATAPYQRHNGLLIGIGPYARFFALPPTNVSSASTNLPSPPIPLGSFPSRIASRIRCVMNHAVFSVTPRIRWSWWLLMPFLLAQSKCVA